MSASARSWPAMSNEQERRLGRHSRRAFRGSARPMAGAARRLLAVLALALPAAVAAPLPAARAAGPRAVHLTASERADVARIERYLNGIRTLSAHFAQYAADGSVETGTLYLDRPGHMRFEYTPPSPLLLLANGQYVVYVDNQLKQVTYLPITSTPAWFLLRDRISLSDGVTITHFEHGPGVIRASLVQTKTPQQGSLTLVFGDRPLELKQWTVIDDEGKRTTVVLSNPEYGVAI